MGERVGGAKADGAPRLVETWLRDSLSRRYDDVLTEALPEAWLRLVTAAAGPEGGR